MKNLNPVVQESILDQTYVSANDIYNLYPFGENASRNILNKIVEELKEEGKMLLPGRPVVVPLSRVLKKYPIDRKGIERASKRLREIKK